MMPHDMIHVSATSLIYWYRYPFYSTISIPENKSFCRSWLKWSFCFAFQQGCDKNLILFAFRQPEGAPWPCTEPGATKNSPPSLQEKQIPPFSPILISRIFLQGFLSLTRAKFVKLWLPIKYCRSPLHCRLYRWESLRNNTGTSWTLHHIADETPRHFCITGTPAVRWELEIQCLDGTVRHICRECHNLSACMDTAIGSSCKKKSCFAPVGKKTQSLAGSNKFSFNGAVCRLHLRAIKPAAQIGYPERQPHRRLHTPREPFDLSPCIIQRLVSIGA